MRISFLKIFFFLSLVFGSQAFGEPITFFIHANAKSPDTAEMVQAGEFVRVNNVGVPFYIISSQSNTYTKSRGILDSSNLREGKNHFNFGVQISNGGLAVKTKSYYLELEVKEKNGQKTFKRISTLFINPGQNSSTVNFSLDLSEISPYIADQKAKERKNKKIKEDQERKEKERKDQERKDQERKEKEAREAAITKETETEHNQLLDKLENIFQKTIRPLCFTEGTKIKASTPEGQEVYRDLETIEIGDKVWTCNFDREVCELRPVISTSKREVQKLYQITTESAYLEVTGEHPFYAGNGQWIEARRLKEGDSLYTSSHNETKILNIEEISGYFHVYNIQVDAEGSNNQNYFVSEQDILVHNCNILAGAALVASGAMLLGPSSAVAGIIIPLASGGITVAQIASADTLADAASDIVFDTAMAVALPGVGGVLKNLGSAAGRVLEFGKLVKSGRDKVLDFAKGIRHSSKMFGVTNVEETKSYINLVKHISDQSPKNIVQFEKLKTELAVEEIRGAKVIGSAMKEDVGHRSASFMLDSAAKEGKVTSIRGDYDGTIKNLLQVEGKLNDEKGIFEWIVSPNGLEHQRFILGGKMTGFPNQNPKKLP